MVGLRRLSQKETTPFFALGCAILIDPVTFFLQAPYRQLPSVRRGIKRRADGGGRAGAAGDDLGSGSVMQLQWKLPCMQQRDLFR
jgi:hypothetical protein